MNKIAVLTTGGTIGSIIGKDNISVDKSSSRISREIEAARRRMGYETDVFSVFNKISEDIVPSDWALILRSLLEVQKNNYDGIVVTHGTDTLSYSLAAALLFSHLWKQKICFTGSFYAPDDPHSDTSINLLAALEFAASAHPASGVYFAFRSNPHNSYAHIHNGALVKPMWFDDEVFESFYDDTIAGFSPNKGLETDAAISFTDYPSFEKGDIPSQAQLEDATNSVLLLKAYPGIDLSTHGVDLMKDKIIIVEMYHSGTAPSDSSANPAFLDSLKKASQNNLILMGTLPSRHIQTVYTSTSKIISAGGHVYKDIQPHYLYVLSLFAIAMSMSMDEVLRLIQPWEVDIS